MVRHRKRKEKSFVELESNCYDDQSGSGSEERTTSDEEDVRSSKRRPRSAQSSNGEDDDGVLDVEDFEGKYKRGTQVEGFVSKDQYDKLMERLKGYEKSIKRLNDNVCYWKRDQKKYEEKYVDKKEECRKLKSKLEDKSLEISRLKATVQRLETEKSLNEEHEDEWQRGRNAETINRLTANIKANCELKLQEKDLVLEELREQLRDAKNQLLWSKSDPDGQETSSSQRAAGSPTQPPSQRAVVLAERVRTLKKIIKKLLDEDLHKVRINCICRCKTLLKEVIDRTKHNLELEEIVAVGVDQGASTKKATIATGKPSVRPTLKSRNNETSQTRSPSARLSARNGPSPGKRPRLPYRGRKTRSGSGQPVVVQFNSEAEEEDDDDEDIEEVEIVLNSSRTEKENKKTQRGKTKTPKKVVDTEDEEVDITGSESDGGGPTGSGTGSDNEESEEQDGFERKKRNKKSSDSESDDDEDTSMRDSGRRRGRRRGKNTVEVVRPTQFLMN